MTISWRPATSHLLLLAGLGCLVLCINARGSEPSLRGLDRDLFSLIRADYPDQLRNLDLTRGLWPKLHLSAMNLAGEDLRGLRMSGNRLSDLDLRGSHLEQAEFRCVSMDNVNLAGAKLNEVKFDYAECAGDGRAKLVIDLNGADLSAAELVGGELHLGNPQKTCKKMLMIKGNLNGAKFTEAMLQCVTLENASGDEKGKRQQGNPIHSTPIPPLYAGINFIKTKVNALTLASGDFRFSDFYQANLQQLTFNPSLASLSFSSLADLQCPDAQPCMLSQVDKQDAKNVPGSRAKVLDGLSLNLRDSRIRSNLSLPSASAPSRGWPALLCNKKTSWSPYPKFDPGPDVVCGHPKTSGNGTIQSSGDWGFLFNKSASD